MKLCPRLTTVIRIRTKILSKIPGKLWNMINPLLLSEKPNNTIGRHIVPCRKVMDEIVYVL